MSTTNILFDSPALHSLKRAQLVQLCKRHNIKASGKNAELVARLKDHAHALPADVPLAFNDTSDAEGGVTGTEADAETEGEGDEGRQRLSEVWEVVMDDVPEEEYPNSMKSKGTRGGDSQNGEFGTAGSSKIMKALASSLGIKRTAFSNSSALPSSESTDTLATFKNSTNKGSFRSRDALAGPFRGNGSGDLHYTARDSLIAHAIPYEEIPAARHSRLPHVEPFTFSNDSAGDTSLADSLDAPVPGIGSRAGIDVESSGVGSSGTIRLITTPYDPERMRDEVEEPPNLTPYKPAFELEPPTPGKPLMRWPMSPEAPSEPKNLYPVLNFEDGDTDTDAALGALQTSSSSPFRAEATSTLSPPPPAVPFVFGSPNPRHSASAGDFANAATSVLAEMNARLGVTGVRGLGADILALAPKKSKLSEQELLGYEFGGKETDSGTGSAHGRGEGSMSSRFDAAHERAFGRMEGIDAHYAARRVLREEAVVPLPDNRKRKSSVLDGALGKERPHALVPAKKLRASSARITSADARKKVKGGMGIPGAFGDEEEFMDEEQEDELDSEPVRETKRACVTRPAENGQGEMRVSIATGALKNQRNKGEDDERARKESETIKRRLELNKARRRSSRGLSAQKQKRLGFFASAKSLVKSVWNRGAGNPSTAKAKPAMTSTLAPASAALKRSLTPTPAPAPPKKVPRKAGQSSVSSKPPLPETKKPVFSVRPAATRGLVADHNGSVGPGRLRPKLDSSLSRPAAAPTPTASHLGEGKVENSNDHTPALEAAAATQGPGQTPMSGSTSTRTRKPSTVSVAGSTTTLATRSRFCAPTASSLAKMNENVKSRLPQPKAHAIGETGATRGKGSRARASAFSPSRIPIFAPPSPRKNRSTAFSHAGTKEGAGIFSSPLMLPSSLQARSAAEKGNNVNAITGAVSPFAQRGPFSSVNSDSGLSLTGVAADMAKAEKAEMKEEMEVISEVDADGPEQEDTKRSPSVLRKPRISRSRVIARLGAQRERIAAAGSPRKPLGSANASANTSANVNGTGTGNRNKSGLASPKFRTRSTAGGGPRRSVGGAKAGAGSGTASVVMMSAKKRARASEYARRRSAKAPAGSNFGSGIEEGMDVDED